MPPRSLLRSLSLAASVLLAGCLPQPKAEGRLAADQRRRERGPRRRCWPPRSSKPSHGPGRRNGGRSTWSRRSLESDQKHYHLTEVLNASRGWCRCCSRQGPFTLFAPTDAAFDKMPPGAARGRCSSRPTTTSSWLFLRYHLLRGRIDFADLLGDQRPGADDGRRAGRRRSRRGPAAPPGRWGRR